MNIIWKYKIEVTDLSVFKEIGEKYGKDFPQELKDFIIEANAATPSKYRYMVGNNERILGAILSFNRNEKDTDSIFTALLAMDNNELIPFGIDPFGNYICYSLDDGVIVFWDHETGKTIPVERSLNNFIESLY